MRLVGLITIYFDAEFLLGENHVCRVVPDAHLPNFLALDVARVIHSHVVGAVALLFFIRLVQVGDSLRRHAAVDLVRRSVIAALLDYAEELI